jgi:hypothetical protein
VAPELHIRVYERQENNKYLFPIATHVLRLTSLRSIDSIFVMLTNEEFYESNTTSDSDDDSVLMEDTHSETISSSITTNGSLSLSDDENFIIINKTSSDRIIKFLRKKNKQKLSKYAKLSGLITTDLRQQIWPLLITTPPYSPVEFNETTKRFFCTNDYYAADKDQIESHRYYGQVRMDVERTLKRFPPSNNTNPFRENLYIFRYRLCSFR